FCPVSKAAEVICQRWTPLIVRELLVGSTRFNEIRRGVPNCSPALLSRRLKELEGAGVVERNATDRAGIYQLTEAGRELMPIVLGLGEWGHRWARADYGPHELDPGLLLWDVRRNLRHGGLSEHPVTINFVFPAVPVKRRFYWMVVDANEVDLCLTDPGRDVDITVEADLSALTKIWMGDARFTDALADERITLRGPKRLIRGFPAWFGQHPHFANVRPAGSATSELRISEG
ncbi:MAG: winged helix-turn-helix transcriptional regulator, partial [Nitrososphaerales archaeon]